MLDDEPSPSTPRQALGLLLESFARTYRYVPERAHAISDPKELPDRLRHLAERHPPLSTWRTWIDDVRLWFVIGRLSDECCCSHDSLLLEMLFVSIDGQPVAAGCWGLSPQGHWVLRHIHEPEKTGLAAPRARQMGATLPLERRDDAHTHGGEAHDR